MRTFGSLLLILTLVACSSPSGPDINTIATDVAGTLQAASTATAGAVSPTSEVLATATETTAAPTAIPSNTPDSNRISLPLGATQAVVTGTVQANQTRTYLASAAQNQIIVASVRNAVLEVIGADGTVLLPASRGWNSFRSLLPKTQDYEFRVVGGNAAQDFTLNIAFAVPVQFAAGSNSMTSNGSTVGGLPVTYAIYLERNKDLQVSLNTSASQAVLSIWGFDGTSHVSPQNQATTFSMDINETQYYIIEVVPREGRVVDFQIQIEAK